MTQIRETHAILCTVGGPGTMSRHRPRRYGHQHKTQGAMPHDTKVRVLTDRAT